MDAGTDNGFTFTSPNWPTSPQGSIFRITNVYPSHPAGSFNYPEKPSLPTIATFTFIKVCCFLTFWSYKFQFSWSLMQRGGAELFPVSWYNLLF